MTADQKDDLRRKKLRFDGLTPAEQQKLRELHASIASDPSSKELQETLKSYHRWLATLDAAERVSLLDIKDPDQRIARIKELMQQQEERRFREFAGNLPEEDRNAVYKWLGDWAVAHADEIREPLPREFRQRIDDAPDDESRRRALVGIWQQSRRHVSPLASDYSDLFKRLSPETQKYIETAAATALASEPETNRTREREDELQQRRIQELVGVALFSRNFPIPSQEELLKFYADMKTDDPRRKQLEGKEGVELRRELMWMYNRERGFGRGGGPPPGGPGRGGFGPSWGPPRGDGRGPWTGGKPGERFDDKDRGPKAPSGGRAETKP
jgi:hypothetical protein